jgi:plastocyanin
VLSLGTKSLFGFAVAAFVASVVYGVATNEGSGTAVLAFVAAGAIGLAAVSLGAGPDRTPVPTVDGPLPQNPPGGGRPMYPSVWPLAAAIGIGVLAVGAATDGLLVVAAIVVGAIALLGWVFQSWTEHPIFTARFGARLTDRLLVPIGLPVGVFALVLVIALSLSRVLLAVPEQGSRVVAIVVAVVILAGAFFIVSQERMARAALSVLSAVALLAVIAAGGVGLAYGERHFEKKGLPAGAGSTAAPVAIATEGNNLAFSTSTLTFPAGTTVPVAFDNQATGIPHDVAIYNQKGGKELFQGAIVTGPTKVTYRVPPLVAGTYWFQCDVHPQMNGTLTVAPAGATGSPAGAASAATPAPTTTAPAAAASTPTTIAVTAGFATTATTTR